MGRRAETKVGHTSIVPVHTRYVVVQDRSAAALGAVGRPSEILLVLDTSRVGKGPKDTLKFPTGALRYTCPYTRGESELWNQALDVAVDAHL